MLEIVLHCSFFPFSLWLSVELYGLHNAIKQSLFVLSFFRASNSHDISKGAARSPIVSSLHDQFIQFFKNYVKIFVYLIIMY